MNPFHQQKRLFILYVYAAKFSDSVPGTIYGREEEDAPTTTVLISTESTTDGDTFTGTSQQPTLLPTGQIPESNTTSGPGGIDNGTLMYIIYAVAVVGVVTLLVVVILLCAVIAFLCCSSSNKNKKKRLAIPHAN